MDGAAVDDWVTAPAQSSHEADDWVTGPTQASHGADDWIAAPPVAQPRSARGWREGPPPPDLPEYAGDKLNPAAIRRDADSMSDADVAKALRPQDAPTAAPEPPVATGDQRSALELANEGGVADVAPAPKVSVTPLSSAPSAPWQTTPTETTGTPPPVTGELPGPMARVAEAAKGAWEGAGPILSPTAERWLLDKGIPPGAISVINSPQYAFKLMGAAFSGGQAAVQEVLTPIIGEQGARDLAAMPEAFMGSPHPTGMPRMPRLTPAESAAMAEARGLSNAPLTVGPETGLQPGEQTPGRAEHENFANMRARMDELWPAEGQQAPLAIAGPEGEAPAAPEAVHPQAPEPIPSAVDQAASQANPEPTPAQIEAGNYTKGHVTIGGLPIAIETPRGGIRRGVGPDGTPWEVAMPAHYGYVNRTTAADGDHLDVTLGPLADQAPHHPVFVVDQIDPQTGQFDEHKGLLGFATPQDALGAYDASFSDGSGPQRRGAVTAMPFDQFKAWATSGDLTKPMAGEAAEGPSDWITAPATPFNAVPYAPTPKEPQRLIPFLQQGIKINAGTPSERTGQFGLKDPGGDLLAIMGGHRARPTFINNANGENLDDAGLRAYQAGYFDHRPDINELLDAIAEDHRGNPQYSAHDQDAVEAYQYAAAHNSEIDNLASKYGLPTRGLTREQFFDRITDHISLEDAAREHDSMVADHQSAYDRALAAARAEGIDPEAYTPRTLEEMEHEHRQADAAQTTGPGGANGQGRPAVAANAGVGQGGAGQGGRGAGVAGRIGAEAGGLDQAAAYREELPGEGLFENQVPLFSPTARAVDGLKQAKGTGEQMLAQITKTPGVKPEELNWMNLPGWLRGQKSVTREQIADYVRANALDVREVERGGKPDIQQTQDNANAAEKVLREILPPVVTMVDGTTMTADQVVSGVARNTFTIRSLPPELRALSYKFGDALDEMRAAMSDERSDTKYQGYSLPGGVPGTYREMLIALPAKKATINYQRMNEIERLLTTNAGSLRPDAAELRAEYKRLADEARGGQNAYHTNHWDEPNVLAHVRFDERTGADGARVLMIHENQSDWHQQGRKQGYAGTYEVVDEDGKFLIKNKETGHPIETEHGPMRFGSREFAEQQMRSMKVAGVPNAPFKATWPALVMKRMLKYAVDNGFDRIAWSPGEVHADRYDLSKQVSRLDYIPSENTIHAYDLHGRHAQTIRDVTPENMPDKIGKEAAEKLLAQPDRAPVTGPIHEGRTWKRLEGADLKVGGEGMKGFYDRILPAETQKIVGKFGAKVGKSRLQEKSPSIANDGPQHANALGVTEVHSVDITPAMRAVIQTQGLGLFAGRRLPTPQPTGPDLFGATRAQPAARAPEPTIRTDQRQAVMPGMEPSAVQAQAARDQSGRGGLAPGVPQAKADEGLFARSEAPTRDIFADTQQQMARQDQQSDAIAAAGQPVKMVHPRGLTALVSPDLENPGQWRVTRFDKDGPIGHTAYPDAKTAALNALREGFEPAPRASRWPTTSGDNFQDRLAEIQHAGHQTAADWVFARGRETGHEHLAVVDNRTGEIIQAHTNGRVNSAGFRGDNGAELPPGSLTLHHNHPNGTALSRPDLTLLANPAISHIVSHGHDGTTTTASLGPKFDGRTGSSIFQISANSLALKTAHAAAEPISEGILRSLMDHDVISPETANQFYGDITNRLLHAQGLIHYTSTLELPSEVRKAFGAVLERLGHGPDVIDRSAVAIRPEERIAGLPAPTSGGQGAGSPGSGAAGQGVSEPGPQGALFESGRVQEGDERAVQQGVSSGADLPPDQKAAIARTLRNGPLPPREMPDLINQGPPKPARERAAAPPESTPQGAIPLREPPQPGREAPAMGHNMPPDSLWPEDQRPPTQPPRSPEVEAARITRPQAVKNLNPVERMAIFPRTLASLDEPSARLWNTWQARERESTINAGQLRGVITPNFLKLSKPERLRVAGAMEIGRVEGAENLLTNPDGTMTYRNTSTPFARWSKVGDAVTLTPQETAAYHEAVQLGYDQWAMLMKAAARRYGWGGDIDPAAIRAATEQHGEPGGYKRLNRLADLLDVMRQHENDIYFPMQRFGSYFIAIRPKQGDAVTANLGGHPPLAWFETVEKPAFQDLLGVTKGRLSVQAVAAKRIAELQKQFPTDKFDIQHGDFARTPSLLRKIDISAVEKLFMLMENKVKAEVQDQVMRGDNPPTTKQGVREEAKNRYDQLHGSTVEAFYDALFEELKSGYRRKAKVVPGYSQDFDRAISSHLFQIARNSADVVHRDSIQSAYDNIQDFHPHDTVKRYWASWRAYQEDPGSTLSRAADTMSQIGFTYVLGMNPSSTIIMASHTPMAAAPVLSVGVGPRVAIPAISRGLGRAYAALRFDTVHGGHIDLDKAMAGMSPEKQAFLRLMANEGRLAAVGTHDMAALNDRLAGLFGDKADIARRGMEIATSNVHAVDQANRFAVGSAAWDIASNPANFNKAATPLMNHSAVFRDMVQREGVSPETYGRFMLSEAAFEWGKQNQPPIQRGPFGRLMFTLHGFQTRYLSTALNLMKNRGPEGKFAALLMLGALALGAGMQGLPFVEDTENGADALWHHFTGRDPDLKHKLHDAIQDAGFGKIGADMVTRGPLSVGLGVNLGSRIGFGDVLSREFESSNALGTIPSIMWSGYSGASQRAASGQNPAAVASEAAPFAVRGPLRAYSASQQGIVSRKGVPQIPPEQLSAADIARLGAGFTPLSVVELRDETSRYIKAQHSQEAWTDMIKSGDIDGAAKEMAAAGWNAGRIKMFARQALQPPAIGKQFQRFEMQRGVAPPP